MIKISALALILATLGAFGPQSQASEKSSCFGVAFSEVRSLTMLPSKVSALLGSERVGDEGIADRGEMFNATDRIDEIELPRRRFNLAAVSTTCIVAAVEVGGRGYSVEVWVFEQRANVWHGEQRKAISSVPSSLQVLIESASR